MAPPTRTEAWSVRAEDYPADAPAAEQLRFLVGYAVLAPSSHNAQPWLFRVEETRVELLADRRRSLPIADPDDRELIMSCGAALQHLRVAMSAFGHRPEVELFPDPAAPDLLARVALGPREPAREEELLLFQSIPRRRTSRAPYEHRAVPPELLAHLIEEARAEGAWLHPVDGEEKWRLASLIAEADRVQGEDQAFRRELAEWIHPNASRKPDGMPGYALGNVAFTSYLGPLLVRTFDVGRGRAARDRQLAAGSPVLAVLGSEHDDPSAWLNTGQALSRVLLLACAHGVSASYLNQPIEVPGLRRRVAELIEREDAPQLVLRMGFGPEVRPTPRRPIADVVV